LVVGDANAKELGTLHELVDVTIIAKPGASWQSVGEDIEAFVSEGLQHKFHMVLPVLGSNEVPKTRARPQTWGKHWGASSQRWQG
jgi:hypothetical protein